MLNIIHTTQQVERSLYNSIKAYTLCLAQYTYFGLIQKQKHSNTLVGFIIKLTHFLKIKPNIKIYTIKVIKTIYNICK